MTIPERRPAEGPTLSEDLPDSRTGSVGRLAQPWRLAVVAAEVVLLVALLFLARWCWANSQLDVSVTGLGPPVRAVRVAGHWVALSVLSGTVAGLVAVDAVRQLLLSWRVRRIRTQR